MPLLNLKTLGACRQLYDLLAHPAVAKRRLPVLLACNKMDMGAKAHTVHFIQKRLEKEIDQVGRNREGPGCRWRGRGRRKEQGRRG